MKKILLLFLFACIGAAAQDKVKFSAKIENRNSDTLTILSRTFKKVILMDKKGTFSDSFSVEPGLYELYDGTEYAVLYLKNGFDLNMTMDAKMFDETIKFTGKGSKENNYLAKKMLDNETFFQNMTRVKEDDAALRKLIDQKIKSEQAVLQDKQLDENFRNIMLTDAKGEAEQLGMMADQMLKARQMKGKPSPAFAYENHKGGVTRLEDLRGKYVYIDVWATWCGPCLQEIPFLQEVEKKYHGKNIEFVSISVDTEKAHDKWKKMVSDRSMGGIQLFADKDWKSDFITAYSIQSIPRFILIDPKGNVVDADAARPSNPVLQEKLDELLK